MSGSSAFLRFSRDRRGYEHFYLIEPTTSRRGSTGARVLYWFRTPPGVKVGRPPFDAEMRRAIQERHPGVSFDWKRILATPIPAPAADVERWRERRRMERAERAAQKAGAEIPADVLDEPRSEAAEQTITANPEAPPGFEEDPDGPDWSEPAADVAAEPGLNSPSAEPGAGSPAAAGPAEDPGARGPGRRRRRRRGGRGRRPAGVQDPASDSRRSESAGPQPAAEHERARNEPQGE